VHVAAGGPCRIKAASGASSVDISAQYFATSASPGNLALAMTGLPSETID